MKENYQSSLAAVLKYEGGFSNHPLDPGGATMKGVTQHVYDAWRKKRALPTRSVKNIDQSEIEAIYRQDYWDAICGDDLPAGVDLATFDFAVNSGVNRAAKFLQTCLGLTPNGVIGRSAIAAAKSKPGVWADLCDRRLVFLKGLSTWSAFGKGWASRVSDVRRRAAALASAKPANHPEAEQPIPGDVAAAQRRLTELNYATGGADGVIGPLTRSAIRDFQDANNLVVSGKLDQATLALLESDDVPPRPVPPERAAMTVADLREGGSKIIAASDETKFGAIGAALATASGVASEAKEVAGQIDDIKTGIASGAGVLEITRDYWPAIVIVLASAAAAYFLWRAYRGAKQVEAERVENARKGINVRL